MLARGAHSLLSASLEALQQVHSLKTTGHSRQSSDSSLERLVPRDEDPETKVRCRSGVPGMPGALRTALLAAAWWCVWAQVLVCRAPTPAAVCENVMCSKSLREHMLIV